MDRTFFPDKSELNLEHRIVLYSVIIRYDRIAYKSIVYTQLHTCTHTYTSSAIHAYIHAHIHIIIDPWTGIIFTLIYTRNDRHKSKSNPFFFHGSSDVVVHFLGTAPQVPGQGWCAAGHLCGTAVVAWPHQKSGDLTSKLGDRTRRKYPPVN